jgi:hypothetical protein
MGNPVVHFEVVGKDAAALQGFYGHPAHALVIAHTSR